MHDLLLRKSDGTFELVVWSEKAEGTNRITVNLGRSHAWVKLYDPTIGITPTEILTGHTLDFINTERPPGHP